MYFIYNVDTKLGFNINYRYTLKDKLLRKMYLKKSTNLYSYTVIQLYGRHHRLLLKNTVVTSVHMY